MVEQVEAVGGAARAIERGMMQEAIARSAYEQQRAIEAAEQVVVGVNRYVEGAAVPSVAAPDYAGLAAQQLARLAEARRTRDGAKVTAALAELRVAAAQPDAPLLPVILAAVRARATVGEISDVLRGEWGVYSS